MDPLGQGKTVLRGGFGIFYDRPFDNLWQNVRNNNFVLPLIHVCRRAQLSAAHRIGAAFVRQPVVRIATFPSLTLMDPKLRNGYAESFFLGVQHPIGDNLTLEVNGTGSVGHRLITTDIVNRQFTNYPPATAGPTKRCPTSTGDPARAFRLQRADHAAPLSAAARSSSRRPTPGATPSTTRAIR